MRLHDLIFENEATGDPADAGAGAPDPGTAPAGTSAGGGEGWSGPSQDEWTQTQQALGAIGQYAPVLQSLAEIMTEQPGQYADQYGGPVNDPYGQQQPQFDPYTGQRLDPYQGQQQDPNAYIDQRMQQMFQERFAPFEPILGQVAEQEGERAARGRLDQLAGQHGEFNRDNALIVAQVYAQNGYAPDQALAYAAQYTIQQEKAMKAAAIEEYQRSLGAAANAPTELGAPGAATQNMPTPTGRTRYEQVVDSWASRRDPVLPTG